MTDDELKARSIELAERAFRLRDRAEEEEVQEKLHSTANELIMIENRQRFYDAQRILEQGKNWTEDQRALAHEINFADRTLRGGRAISFHDSVGYLTQWYNLANDNPNTTLDQLMITLGEQLKVLKANDDEGEDVDKQAVNFIISYVEDVIHYSHHDDNPTNEGTNSVVLMLRDIRDSMLVHRELLFDKDELTTKYEFESLQINRLGFARHQLDELYKAAGR